MEREREREKKEILRKEDLLSGCERGGGEKHRKQSTAVYNLLTILHVFLD